MKETPRLIERPIVLARTVFPDSSLDPRYPRFGARSLGRYSIYLVLSS